MHMYSMAVTQCFCLL